MRAQRQESNSLTRYYISCRQFPCDDGFVKELNAVTIVKRGNTVGYDNPGFESPWTSAFSKRAPKLSTLDWPDSPNIGHRDGIVCEGSSTPTRSVHKSLDTDSAFQEPSIAVSFKFSTFYCLNALLSGILIQRPSLLR